MESQKVMFDEINEFQLFDRKIEVKRLSLVKQSDYILKNINLNIKSKGITFIVGPNGSGKTQFVRCLHGLEKVKGSIKFNNLELTKEIKKKQSFVFQQPTILRRSVLENLTYFSKFRNINGYLKKCIDLLKFVKLEKFINKPAMTLSGGEKQRLSLARALTTNPHFLFLDESTAHLDPISLNIIELALREINKKGTKVIFISHDLNLVKRLADDVIFMHKGNIKEYDTLNNIFNKPKSRITELYLKGKFII
tara:strand:- start:513 stop:1265 length:753 start_codon:yes stop_codon:yes gene_type:complete